jgi:hypothetical protein
MPADSLRQQLRLVRRAEIVAAIVAARASIARGKGIDTAAESMRASARERFAAGTFSSN